jgi:hypothetical protein
VDTNVAGASAGVFRAAGGAPVNSLLLVGSGAGMAATGAAGTGIPAVAGGMRPLSGVRKDTDAALPMRARTPAAANRVNLRA